VFVSSVMLVELIRLLVQLPCRRWQRKQMLI